MDDGWAEGLGAVQTGRQGCERNTSPGQGDGRGGRGGHPTEGDEAEQRDVRVRGRRKVR